MSETERVAGQNVGVGDDLSLKKIVREGRDQYHLGRQA